MCLKFSESKVDSVSKKQQKEKKGGGGRGRGRRVKKGITNERSNLSSRGFHSCREQGDGDKAAMTPPAASELHAPAELEQEQRSAWSSECSDAESEQSAEAGNVVDRKEEKKEVVSASQKKRRYILFVGNLSQTALREDIVSHFEKRGVPVKEFRLLSFKDSGKSRGCGFMELGSDKAMQNALKFHRSRVLGKCINVEVTCGGGGKSERRKVKITEKNRKLRMKKAMAKPIKHAA